MSRSIEAKRRRAAGRAENLAAKHRKRDLDRKREIVRQAAAPASRPLETSDQKGQSPPST
jgi:hypothetical protein